MFSNHFPQFFFLTWRKSKNKKKEQNAFILFSGKKGSKKYHLFSHRLSWHFSPLFIFPAICQVPDSKWRCITFGNSGAGYSRGWKSGQKYIFFQKTAAWTLKTGLCLFKQAVKIAFPLHVTAPTLPPEPFFIYSLSYVRFDSSDPVSTLTLIAHSWLLYAVGGMCVWMFLSRYRNIYLCGYSIHVFTFEMCVFVLSGVMWCVC